MCERHGKLEKRQGPVTRLLLSAIRIYQLSFSMIFGRSCRFLPTCSDYAAEAIRRHGLARGTLLALARISRCHPWGGDGFDPVPERSASRKLRFWR
ncbi:hypothetical protein BH10PSE7_BH10PSE7_27180 [soil metagenome]